MGSLGDSLLGRLCHLEGFWVLLFCSSNEVRRRSNNNHMSARGGGVEKMVRWLTMDQSARPEGPGGQGPGPGDDTKEKRGDA